MEKKPINIFKTLGWFSAILPLVIPIDSRGIYNGRGEILRLALKSGLPCIPFLKNNYTKALILVRFSIIIF